MALRPPKSWNKPLSLITQPREDLGDCRLAEDVSLVAAQGITESRNRKTVIKGADSLYRHRLVFTAGCLGMLLFGITLTTLGAALPPLMDRYGLRRADAGALLALLSLGILAGSLIFGPIVDRFGYRVVLIACAMGVGLGLEGIARAPSQRSLAFAVLLFGVSGGVVNGSTNALVSDISGVGRSAGLALLGVFFGIGALGVPLVLGFLLRWLDYGAILASIGLLVLIPVVFVAAIAFPPPKQARGFPLAKAGSLLLEPTLLLLGGMLFFQSGMEITLGGWSARYAREVLEVNERQSALVLSLFWAGMLTARLVLTAILRRGSPGLVLMVFLAAGMLGSALLLASVALAMVTLGLFVLGFGLAAGFPIVLGKIGEIHPDLTGTAFSIAFVMALTGGSALPYLTGVLGDLWGLRASLLIVPASILAMAVLLGLVRRRLPAPPIDESVTTNEGNKRSCSRSNG
jgi:fucose permease